MRFSAEDGLYLFFAKIKANGTEIAYDLLETRDGWRVVDERVNKISIQMNMRKQIKRLPAREALDGLRTAVARQYAE